MPHKAHSSSPALSPRSAWGFTAAVAIFLGVEGGLVWLMFNMPRNQSLGEAIVSLFS